MNCICLLIDIDDSLITFAFSFLVRPTLDVLQKARSNMEHHLKESHLSDNIQSQLRQRTNRLD
jgi:hypothetical protein